MSTARFFLLILLAIGSVVAAVPASAQQVIGTVGVGTSPVAVAVNPVTNTIYVVNTGATHNVTVINGVTDATTSVTVGNAPINLAVNSVTNKIYVVNNASATVTVIDGVTLATSTVSVGVSPFAIAINQVTNKIYVTNEDGTNSVTVIDGATLATTSIPVGNDPDTIAVNSVTNRIYVGNYHDNTVTVIEGATNNTATVSGVRNPIFLAANSVTNKIYVADFLAQTVTVIDGITLHTQTIPAGNGPFAVAINPVTNEIYVTNQNSNDVTVIDGATNQSAQVPVGNGPFGVTVNEVTNKIYVADASVNEVTMIDGATNLTTNIAVGVQPQAIAANATSNRIYVGNYTDDTVSVIFGAGSTAQQFVPVTPCRLLDTRPGSGGTGPIQGGTYASFNLPQLAQSQHCADLSTATAYSLNVTLVPVNGGRVGYLTIWPMGEDQPFVSTMNSDGRNKANAAIVPAGYQGGVSVYVANTTNVLIDIDGFFAPGGASTLQFYPLMPCRVVDTRGPNGTFGGPPMQGGTPRNFPIEQSSCNIPTSAQAYSLNFTVVPHGSPVRYLTTWPLGQSQPNVSTLNDPTGTTVANAAIVPAGNDQSGSISVFTTDNTDLLIDIDGYFAAPGMGGLSLYPTGPCRVLDTRNGSGAFQGELTVPVGGTNNNPSPCGLTATPQAYVLNATVVPPGDLGYLTLWPDGEMKPTVSTLNAQDGAITSNMAVVPTTDGSIDAYASSLTQLLLDISSYFAP